MSAFDKAKAVVLLAVVGGAGYLAWRAYKTGTGALAGITQAAQQAGASLESAVMNNFVQPFMDGRRWMETGEEPYKGEKAWLYSDYGYTGVDPSTGKLVVEGEWFGDVEARRYSAQQYDKGAAPAAQSINGAAFGIYPSAGARLSVAAARQASDRFAATDPRRLDL